MAPDTELPEDDAVVVDAEVVESDATEPDADAVDADVVGAPSTDESPEQVVLRERAEYLDALRRMQADFENYRKRALKQQVDAIERASGQIVEDLLPVLDACEAGIEHGDEGVTSIFAALLGALEKTGLVRQDPVGEPFDPNAHEAVLHEAATEGDGPVVAEVMRPGYTWKGRVLRAAMVKVRG